MRHIGGCQLRLKGFKFRENDLGGVRRGVRTLFDQSEHGYSVRHGVYVRFSTNQSTAIAYVTGCTFAF